MGLVRSFINSFIVFWAAFLFIMVALDIRAIILRELPPLITYQYAANLMLESFPSLLTEKFAFEYVIGLFALVLSSILIGFISDNFFDSVMGPVIFLSLLIILSLPFYQLVYAYASGNIRGIELADRLPKGFLNMIIAIIFSVIGNMSVKEREPELMKEIEIK